MPLGSARSRTSPLTESPMRIELLAKRLADKTGTPLLEQVVLKQASVLDLPTRCMLWTGSMSGPHRVPRMRKVRDHHNMQYASVVVARAYSIINHKGGRVSVPRLIHLLLHRPDHQFRMRALCESPCCVNPLHWSADPVDTPMRVPVDFSFSDNEWSDADVEEILEILLTEYSPKTWADVIAAPIMDGAPEEMIRKGLTKLGKRHLL